MVLQKILFVALHSQNESLLVMIALQCLLTIIVKVQSLPFQPAQPASHIASMQNCYLLGSPAYK